MRYPFIHAERQRYPVRLLCAVLQVSRSGYYRFVQGGGGQAQPDPAFIAQVQRLYRASRGTYGSRRLCVALQQAGCQVGRHRTRTLMRQAHLQPRRVRRRPHTTDSRYASPIAPNVLNRQFAMTAPPIGYGGVISRPSGPRKGGCILRLWLICFPAKWWGGPVRRRWSHA